MEFDVSLPIVLFAIVAVAVFLYRKLEQRTKILFEDRKLTTRDAVLIVLMMGVTVTIIAFVPNLAIQLLLIAAYSYMMFSFAYIILKKWYVAVFLPIVFILTYIFYPSLFVLSVFAAFFAIIVSVYLGSLFSWKTMLIFASILTVMDVIQVFGTGFMIQAAEKLISLRLPVGVAVPTYPYQSDRGIFLGLGDIFLAGLFSIQSSLKYGQRAGIITAATVGFAMFVFEVMLFNGAFGGIGGFPATVVVILGWMLGMGIVALIQRTGRLSK